ncbi:MAG: alanyl-tRNA synthetase [Candidatus Roizmanbacteria bacterium GW2011_GWC2_34_23]|uniref:alanine--tRNA ligase n=2 Tax=Candidatus Roizmaniibacteriota TaxID=1752723 RepID=A0A0G0B047_9BACT|nr:MAG: alanyl-tRNA synthetase [Candidatus Roizmanbacteria bacterium GW2011_GWC2_34_23]
MLTHVQLRKKFAEFWKKNNHKEIPPIPLVPQNDPTTLFTGSGMQQLVPYLLGETHPLGKRVYNIQPCIRAQDIEEVGDNRHDTFFEMMGNWSLGDYFKKEQLTWFWEFLTNELKLPKEKLYVTVFAGDKKNNLPPDKESIQIWGKIGIPENKIFKYGPERNWWSRAGVPDNMPIGEPGGPDSEVFYEFTKIPHNKKFGGKCHPNCDCGRFIEIGNSVFMQYKKLPDGTFQELPAMNVDFGGGLERITMAIEDKNDLFETNIFVKIILALEKLTGKKYQDNKKEMRIVADHLKTSIFLIKQGVMPSNKEQGYILRRLLRKASFNLHKMGIDIKQMFLLDELCQRVIETYGDIYFDIKNDNKNITPVIQEEMNKFGKALTRGMSEIKNTPDNELENKAFYFYQSYGLPLELLEEIFDSQNKKVNKIKFRKEFEKHKELSRSGSAGKFKGGLADHSVQTIKYHTATHLLHQALFDVVGKDIRQEGSNITTERLRFDFASTIKPTEEQIKEVEKIINNKIKESLPVEYKIVPKEEALKLGARSFFREKYPDMVKVYFIDDYSKEFCGGPHVKNTSEIGKIEIYKFEKIGSNLYRIYAK